jgi:hypothetical protein
MSASSFNPDLYETYLLNIFKSVLKHIFFSYNEIIHDGKTVRKNSKGIDVNNGMPLENSLTNMLLKYLQDPASKKRFGLELCGFLAEPAAINDNNKTEGFIDIFVTSVTSKFTGANDESIYFAFECKRLNHSNYANYVDKGILRFITCKYSKKMSFAGMIGYCEEDKSDIKTIVDKINNNLNVKFKKRKISESSLDKFKIQNDFYHCYISKHERKNLEPIELYHLILDYSNIIE